jgi:hypothetical protein
MRESGRAVRLASGEENLGPIYFLFDGVRTVSSFETSCARSADLSSPWQNPVRWNGAADNGDSNDFGAPAVVGLKTKCFSNLEPREAIE